MRGGLRARSAAAAGRARCATGPAPRRRRSRCRRSGPAPSGSGRRSTSSRLISSRRAGAVAAPARRRQVGGARSSSPCAISTRALHRVVQLAHVARPGVLEQRLQRRGVEAGRRACGSAAACWRRKWCGQRRDVLAPLAQRRQVDLDGVEAEEQVLAEAARGHLLRAGRRWWRRGCARPPGACATSRPRSNSPVSSTRSSLACRLSGTLAISSRNSVPPSASSKRPTRSALASVKAPFTWPNSSLSNTPSRQPARVDRDERPRRRAARRRAAPRATTPLPVPFSPVISTLASEGPTRSISSQHRLHGRRLGDQLRPALARAAARFSASSRWPRRSARPSSTWVRSDRAAGARCPTASGRSRARPRRMASTASSTLPQAVITTTGSVASSACRRVEQVQPLLARGGVARVVEVHQHGVELARLERRDHARPARWRSRSRSPRP